MPTSRGPKPKRSIQLPTERVEVQLVPVPYFAFRPLNPELQGRLYTGKSPDDALINARADVARHFKGIAIPKIIVQE